MTTVGLNDNSLLLEVGILGGSLARIVSYNNPWGSFPQNVVLDDPLESRVFKVMELSVFGSQGESGIECVNCPCLFFG